MTSTRVAGILGATGAVGSQLTAALIDTGIGVRLGGRRLARLAAAAGRHTGAPELVQLDAADEPALARFCAGCDVVINCAATATAGRESVAATALASGAHYVDPGGDEQTRARLAEQHAAAGRAAVLCAGVQPGLSALLARWLAAQAGQPSLRLTAYAATLARMTRASAAEFLRSLAGGYGEPHAMWRAGVRQPGALALLQDIRLPFFTGDLVAYPYLSLEAERLARSLGLAEARCYHVFEAGGRFLAVLGLLQRQLRDGVPVADLAAELVTAADIEMFGREPALQFVMQVDSQPAGQAVSRVAVLRGTSTYRLTATVTALAVTEVLAGSVPAGAHFAADVLDPEILDRLPGMPGVTSLQVLCRPLAACATIERGTI